jgi:hypothetical protein
LFQLWMRNRSTRRKPAAVPLCPPQIPRDLDSIPGRRCGKPALNHLSYSTAFTLSIFSLSVSFLFSSFFLYVVPNISNFKHQLLKCCEIICSFLTLCL